MQGILGLALVVIAFILLYDVFSGKSQAILSLFSGQADYVSQWYGGNTTSSIQNGSTQVNNTNTNLLSPTNTSGTLMPVYQQPGVYNV